MATTNKKRPHTVDVHVGQRIRHHRRVIGMSMEKMAAEIGISYQQLQKYETGANRVVASRLHAVARVLDMPVASFFEGLQKSKSKSDKELEKLTAALSSREVFNLNHSFMRIKDRKLRRKIIDLIGRIADMK